MSKPRLLDLFCSAGGATKGYQRAGFHVTGVDIQHQKHYIGDVFHQADALEFLAAHGDQFDAIHASPPCQSYSRIAKMPNRAAALARYPELIEPVRDMLEAIGKYYVIENVPDAPLRNPVILCGAMFHESHGLWVFKHRAFETNWPLAQPAHVKHPGTVKAPGQGARMALWMNKPNRWITVAGNQFGLQVGRDAMGIQWMNRHELAEAIPPAYTEYIGTRLMNILRVELGG